jgi:hypothetical protein
MGVFFRVKVANSHVTNRSATWVSASGQPAGFSVIRFSC